MDVDVTNDRLRERIRSVKIEQADLKNRLTRTDDVLERGAKTLLTYVEMLADPERLYRDSPNRVRRLLLEAFFTWVRVDEDLTVKANGEMREAVQELKDADQSFNMSRLESVMTTETRERAPGHRTRGSESNIESRLADFLAIRSSE
jgi:hypothetical protein